MMKAGTNEWGGRDVQLLWPAMHTRRKPMSVQVLELGYNNV
jgi:hypothetical protein